MKLKTCKRCEKQKPLDSFYVAKYSRDGHESSCKLCMRQVAKNRYQEPMPFIHSAIEAFLRT